MPPRRRPLRPWPDLQRAEPPPSGQAAAFAANLEEQIIQILGAVPLLLPYLERLGLREIVNRQLAASTAAYDPGLVVVLLCLNRLLAPTPLVHVESWLAGTVVPDLLGIDAAQFNDDRLARTLDDLAPHLETIWQELIGTAIVAFDLDLSQLCYDITSISFTGDYLQADLVRYGYSRDHRPDLKQVNLAVNVTLDGGVPLDYRVLAGNTADRSTPVDNLTRLCALLARLPQVDPAHPPRTPLVISDRAMLTPESMAAYDRHGVRFLGGYDGGAAAETLLRAVPVAELAQHPLAYRPQRNARDEAWAPYQGVLRTLGVLHPDAGHPPLRVRALVVWSPAKARLDAQLRATHIARLEAKLSRLAAQIERQVYTKRATIQKRVARLLRHNPARPFVAVTVTGDDGQAGLTWQRQEQAIQTAAEEDGRYLLVTNDETLDAEAMLSLSKKRDVVEKRFGTVKGPLVVRPVYVHKQERILGLAFCTMLALLIYALIEVECKRVERSTTVQRLISDFASLTVVITRFADGSSLQRLSGVHPDHVILLDMLGLPCLERYTILRC